MLGPAGSARCQLCGYKVGVDPLRALLAMLPLFLLVISISTGLLTDALAAVVLLLVLLSVCSMLYLYWVPLNLREITDRRLVEAARTRIAEEKRATRT